MRIESCHGANHRKADTGLAMTIKDEVETRQCQRHQGESRSLAMVIGCYDDKEIAREGDGEGSYYRQPLIDLHAAHQGKETETIYKHDGEDIGMPPLQYLQ